MTFKLANINIRSLFTGFHEFNNLIQSNSFSVIGVTETWLSRDIMSATVNIQNYKFFRCDRPSRGGGVGLYVKSSLNCTVVYSSSDPDLEQLWLKVKLLNVTFGVGVIYRPPRSSIAATIDMLENSISNILPTIDNIIVMGDFNLNFFDIDDSNVSKLCRIMDSFGLIQTIHEPTRIGNSNFSLIDQIFMSSELSVIHSGTLDVGHISDHHLTFTTFECDGVKYAQKFLTFRNFKYFNYEEFNNDLASIDWAQIYQIHDVDNKINFITDNITALFAIHSPIETVRITKPKAPWLTDVLKLIMRTRNQAKSKYKKTGLQSDADNYKQWRNFALAAIRREKKGYLDFVSSNNNKKELWKRIRELNIRPNKAFEIPSNLSEPNSVNNFFTSVAQSFNEDCTELKEYYSSNTFKEGVSFNFHPVDPEVISNVISTFKSNASGIDGISLEMIKLCMPTLLLPLTHIVNLCLEVGYFPASWKVALVCPLPKIANPKTYSDLRPISLLPFLSKVLERIVYQQVYDFLNQNSILPPCQSGFRKGHSTATTLLKICNDILKARDHKELTALILLDFSKAFDTINHELLCCKLKYFGFDGISVSFFQSFLNNRLQKVQVNNNWSDSKELINGVPQGSILGPLLFIIYTSDLSRNLEYSKCHFYADDTQMYSSFTEDNSFAANEFLNRDINTLLTTAKKHNLHINPLKSSLLLFGNSAVRLRVADNIQIKINDFTLPISTSKKNLGVIVDSELKFSGHISMCLQKSYSSMKLLYANRGFLSQKVKVLLCEHLVLSFFNYCDTVYGPCLDAFDSYRVQKVQNYCCRFVFGLRKFDQISQKFKDLNWLNMKNRRILHSAVGIHKIIRVKTPSYLYSEIKFRGSLHSVSIRHPYKIHIPQHSTAKFQSSFSYQAPLIYNDIDDDLKLASVPTFKRKYKKILLENQ